MKEDIREEWERRNVCAKYKKIYSGEGYPYKRTLFGKVKNWVCKKCAKELGIA